MKTRAKSPAGGVLSRYDERRRDESLFITTGDGGPADVEHVLLANAIARGLSIEDANAIGAKLARPATFGWELDP